MLVFSSALSTYSSAQSGWPCQVQAYRSSTGPASSRKCGSRGKIQHLYRQGRNASCFSNRQMLLRDGHGSPSLRAVTSAAISARLYRLSGTVRSAGRSQANATVSARVTGRMQVGRPRRGRSLSPVQRWTTKRATQRRTVVRLIPACCARRRDPNPAALPRINRARRARRCAVVPARTQPCN